MCAINRHLHCIVYHHRHLPVSPPSCLSLSERNQMWRGMKRRCNKRFVVDTLARHALYSGQMVCGALWRTVLRLHQSLRRGGWVIGHVSTDLALDSTPCSVETWPGNWPNWVREQEQTDERNPDECPPSQAAPACPNPGQHD